MSLIRFLYAPHDLMFVKGIIFKNVDLQKHQKCSTLSKWRKSLCLQAFSLIHSIQRTSSQDMGKTINLHTQSSQRLSDKALSVKLTSTVLFPMWLNCTLEIVCCFYYNVRKERRCCL